MWVCPECKSSDIHEKVWAEVNGATLMQVVDPPDSEYWCPQCNDGFELPLEYEKVPA